MRNITQLTAILASEIECEIFEKHMMPALKIVEAILQKTPEAQPTAYLVIGHYEELFMSRDEACKYANRIKAKVVPLYSKDSLLEEIVKDLK